MPITPFHFGPGVFIKTLTGNNLSCTTFALTNCMIDLEPIVHFLITGDPAHHFFHTLPGATLAAAVAVWPGRRGCESWLRFWNSRLNTAQAKWLGTRDSIGTMPALAGAILGAWTHIGLDMSMHIDVKPLWPLLESNHWHGWISVDAVHQLCIGSGLAALVAGLGIHIKRRA